MWWRRHPSQGACRTDFSPFAAPNGLQSVLRRAAPVIGSLFVLAFLAIASAQEPPATPPPEPAKDVTLLSHALFVPADAELRNRLRAVPDYIREEAWAVAHRDYIRRQLAEVYGRHRGPAGGQEPSKT